MAELSRGFPDTDFYECDIGSMDQPTAANARFDVVSAMDVMFRIVDDDAFEGAVRNVYETESWGLVRVL